MATLKFYIPYKNLPDSWVRIENDDVIFLDGNRFYGPKQALRYLIEQFDDDALAYNYLVSLQDKDRFYPVFDYNTEFFVRSIYPINRA